MNFIKKIKEGNFDSLVHLQFQKFSRGEFLNRALIEAKSTSKNYAIKTSPEFANELVRIMAEKLGPEKTKVTGAIISTMDLKDDLEFKEIKQFQGVKRYLVDFKKSGEEIISLLDKFPKNFFALSFNVGEDILKIKPKAPKSGKPGKGDEKPKVDFCSLKTTDKKIAQDFIFEKEDFKKAEISHDFIIEKIKIPDELKDSKDFALIREESKRVGKVVRRGEIDGEKIEEEFELRA